MQKIFKSVLCEFNSFEALNGFFRQVEGCSMGSKLSSSLANIFCHMFETTIIQPEIENKNLVGYWRYVDDVLVIVKKGYKDTLLDKLNNFDKNLKFTTESMENGRLNFLDTTIILETGSLHLEQFRKPAASDCVVNFKKSISPKNYKWSNFIGEIHRANNTTSTVAARDIAIENTKQIFLKNEFPLAIMDQKIFEIKNRNFAPSEYKLIREQERQNPELEFHTKQVTPNFRLNIVFSTIKQESIILPRMKPKKHFTIIQM